MPESAPHFPPLETPRLILRPISHDDTAFVFRHFSDPQVTRYLLAEDRVTTLEGAAALVDSYVLAPEPRYNRWVLLHKADGEPIGTCGYHKWNAAHHRAELGYDLSPPYQGAGYMTEALRVVLAHGFQNLRLRRIEALVAIGNIPSARLLRRLGFRYEGVLHDYFYSDGGYHDHALFALLEPAL